MPTRPRALTTTAPRPSLRAADARSQPRLQRHHHSHARAQHRDEHRRLKRRQCSAAPAAVVSAPGARPVADDTGRKNQYREPAPRARELTTERARDTDGCGRQPRAHAPSVADRESHRRGSTSPRHFVTWPSCRTKVSNRPVRPCLDGCASRCPTTVSRCYFTSAGLASQSSKRISPSRASSPGTSVRSPSSAPK
jgi:hypothetical protein